MNLSHEMLSSSFDEAVDYVNNVVNGNFLYRRPNMKVVDKIDVCISTICALSKEFALDWAESKIDLSDVEAQRDLLSCFGAYLDVPLRSLSNYMRRIYRASLKKRIPNFQHLLAAYCDELALKRAKDHKSMAGMADPCALIIAHLAVAIHAHSLWQSRRPVSRLVPWTLRVSGKNRVILRYHFNKKYEHRGTIKLKRSYVDFFIPIEIASNNAISLDYVKDLAQDARYGKRKAQRWNHATA